MNNIYLAIGIIVGLSVSMILFNMIETETDNTNNYIDDIKLIEELQFNENEEIQHYTINLIDSLNNDLTAKIMSDEITHNEKKTYIEFYNRLKRAKDYIKMEIQFKKANNLIDSLDNNIHYQP